MNEPEIWMQGLLVILAICVVLTCGLMLATIWLLVRAQAYTRRLRRGPEVVRDNNGRPYRERI